MIDKVADYIYAFDVASIVTITDQNGVITHVNDNFCKISKYAREELIGQNHRITKSDYHSPEFFTALWNTISEGKVWQGEIRNKAKDGTYYWVDTTIVPLLDDTGRPEKYLSIRIDITDRKKSKEEIIHLNNTLVEKVSELQTTNKQLQDFCNILSHDLRAPLNNIIMLSEFLAKSKNAAEQQLLLSKLLPVTAQMNEIFNDLLSYIQTDHRRGNESEYIDLNDMADKIISSLAIQIRYAEAKIERDFQAVPQLHYPKKYLQSILSNLLTNAIKYRSPERPLRIRIKTVAAGNQVELSVEDNGLGIDLEKYGDQMFKVKQTFHDHPEANGFGLYMIKNQIESMGDEIKIQSIPDKGTIMTVTFKNQV